MHNQDTFWDEDDFDDEKRYRIRPMPDHCTGNIKNSYVLFFIPEFQYCREINHQQQ